MFDARKAKRAAVRIVNRFCWMQWAMSEEIVKNLKE